MRLYRRIAFSPIVLSVIGICGAFAQTDGHGETAIFTSATLQAMTIDGKIKRIKDSCNVCIGKDWFYQSVDFTFLDGERNLEQNLSKILFKTENTSLTDAYSNYVSGFAETKPARRIDKDNELYIKLVVDTLCYKPGKYIGLHTTKLQQTVEKNKANLQKSERHIIYDILHGKVLSLDDIFLPEVVNTVKQKLGNARLHMAMTDEGIVFGTKRKNNLNIFMYSKYADHFSQDFKQLVDIDWQKLEEMIRSEKTKEVENRAFQMPPTGDMIELFYHLSTQVYDVVEQMPSFPGGTTEMDKYFSTHTKYPVKAKENGIQGRAIVTFVVERDGSISNVKVAKEVEPSLDKEAMRVVMAMPKWNPGMQNGYAERVRYTVPVNFRL